MSRRLTWPFKFPIGMRVWLFLAIFALPLSSVAQFDSLSLGNFTGDQARLELSPSYPAPYEEVEVTLSDPRSSTRSYEIEWYINGTNVPEFKNQRTIKTVVGDLGQTYIIKATLTSGSGVVETLSHTVNPVYLDIIIEPQTHVPSFYRGRALPSHGSKVNATALLEGATESADNLLFSWQLNNKPLFGGAVRGTSYITFTMPQDTRNTLVATVSTLDGTVLAKRAFSIKAVRPELKFYEVNTLYGISHLPTTVFNLIADSATLRAEPYYLDSEIYNHPDISLWKVNSTEYPQPANPYEATLERSSTESGTARLSFRVQSLSNLLQGAQSEITLRY